MNNTDKQPQTVYVPFDKESETVLAYSGYKIESVYIHTPEELEALLQKERREAAEKAWNESVKMSANKAGMHASSVLYLLNSSNSTSHDKETYLNTYYPKPINTNL